MNKVPDKIYLQIDNGEDMTVTWSADQIYDTDVLYVRSESEAYPDQIVNTRTTRGRRRTMKDNICPECYGNKLVCKSECGKRQNIQIGSCVSVECEYIKSCPKCKGTGTVQSEPKSQDDEIREAFEKDHSKYRLDKNSDGTYCDKAVEKWYSKYSAGYIKQWGITKDILDEFNRVDAEVNDLLGVLKERDAKIESMKCCGNCREWTKSGGREFCGRAMIGVIDKCNNWKEKES